MAGYALYAEQQGWGKADEIGTLLAYLALPSYKERRVDTSTLGKVRNLIQASLEGMNAKVTMDTAKAVDFPMTDKSWECNWCEFRKVCGKGEK